MPRRPNRANSHRKRSSSENKIAPQFQDIATPTDSEIDELFAKLAKENKERFPYSQDPDKDLSERSDAIAKGFDQKMHSHPLLLAAKATTAIGKLVDDKGIIANQPSNSGPVAVSKSAPMPQADGWGSYIAKSVTDAANKVYSSMSSFLPTAEIRADARRAAATNSSIVIQNEPLGAGSSQIRTVLEMTLSGESDELVIDPSQIQDQNIVEVNLKIENPAAGAVYTINNQNLTTPLNVIMVDDQENGVPMFTFLCQSVDYNGNIISENNTFIDALSHLQVAMNGDSCAVNLFNNGEISDYSIKIANAPNAMIFPPLASTTPSVLPITINNVDEVFGLQPARDGLVNIFYRTTQNETRVLALSSYSGAPSLISDNPCDSIPSNLVQNYTDTDYFTEIAVNENGVPVLTFPTQDFIQSIITNQDLVFGYGSNAATEIAENGYRIDVNNFIANSPESLTIAIPTNIAPPPASGQNLIINTVTKADSNLFFIVIDNVANSASASPISIQPILPPYANFQELSVNDDGSCSLVYDNDFAVVMDGVTQQQVNMWLDQSKVTTTVSTTTTTEAPTTSVTTSASKETSTTDTPTTQTTTTETSTTSATTTQTTTTETDPTTGITSTFTTTTEGEKTTITASTTAPTTTTEGKTSFTTTTFTSTLDPTTATPANDETSSSDDKTRNIIIGALSATIALAGLAALAKFVKKRQGEKAHEVIAYDNPSFGDSNRGRDEKGEEVGGPKPFNDLDPHNIIFDNPNYDPNINETNVDDKIKKPSQPSATANLSGTSLPKKLDSQQGVAKGNTTV